MEIEEAEPDFETLVGFERKKYLKHGEALLNLSASDLREYYSKHRSVDHNCSVCKALVFNPKRCAKCDLLFCEPCSRPYCAKCGKKAEKLPKKQNRELN